MYKDKKIGISILNYNSAEKTVDSVNKIAEYEIIDKIVVVDNNSSDNSLEVLNLLEKYNNIKLLKNPRNGGWSYGQNTGCKYLTEQCGIDYILIMTPANFFTEEVLIELINELSSNIEKYAVLAPVMKEEGNISTARSAWRRPLYFDLISSDFFLLRKIIVKPLHRQDYKFDISNGKKIIQVEAVQGSLYLIDAAALKEIDYFDEDIFLYNEENVLSYKLYKAGYKEGVLNWCEYYHKAGYSVNKNFSSVKRQKFLFDSQYIYAQKYLKVSALKLHILQITQKYGMFEKKIIEAIRGLVNRRKI